MANTNIINAVFGSGLCAVTTSAFRANYGMKLRFSGIDLPTAFEVDFSNYDVMGHDSVTAIGQNGEVQIPDQLWDSGMNIYAYVYLHPTDDSGVTVYTVTIPVLGRPNRTDEEPTPHEQTVIEQAISALNEAVEQTAADVVAADASAQAAAQSEANASVSERSAAASASAALASQNAAESAAQSATESASGASESARNAANSASQAAQSATAAQESAEQAEQAVQSITDDVERAERAANTATGKATEAASSAATASTKAAQAEQSATAAAQSASSASTAAQNAAESEQLAESHATDAETAKQDAQDAQTAAEQAAESVSGLSAQIAQNTADIADLVQNKAGALVDTVSGSIASFVPDSTIPTVKGLTVNVEPVQSGSGDPSPDNIRPISGWDSVKVWDDPKYGGTIKWNQIVKNGDFSEGTRYWTGSSATLTATDGVARATLRGSAWNNDMRQNTIPLTNGHIYCLRVLARQSSTDFSLTLRNPGGQSASNYFKSTTWTQFDGLIKATASAPNGFALSVREIGTTLAGEWFEAQNFNAFDLTAMFGSTVADYIYSLETATAGAGVAYFRNLFPQDYYPFDDSYTETCVSAVNGDPYRHYTIPLGQSVYGGTLDVTNGVLTVDRAMVDMGTLTWVYDSSLPRFYTTGVPNAKGVASNYDTVNAISSMYTSTWLNNLYNTAQNGLMAYSTGGALSVINKAYTNSADFKTAMSGVQLCYELATPITIDLTPIEISVLTGQNNIWADSGDVSVEYAADLKTYINNKIAAAVAALS